MKRTFPENLSSLAQKMEKYRFFFMFLRKFTLKKLAVHTFVSKAFNKNYNISKVK